MCRRFRFFCASSTKRLILRRLMRVLMAKGHEKRLVRVLYPLVWQATRRALLVRVTFPPAPRPAPQAAAARPSPQLLPRAPPLSRLPAPQLAAPKRSPHLGPAQAAAAPLPARAPRGSCSARQRSGHRPRRPARRLGDQRLQRSRLLQPHRATQRSLRRRWWWPLLLCDKMCRTPDVACLAGSASAPHCPTPRPTVEGPPLRCAALPTVLRTRGGRWIWAVTAPRQQCQRDRPRRQPRRS
eukprot:COSAG04_NODE_225_length_19578_cov_17.172647_12_plen_240_part_00